MTHSRCGQTARIDPQQMMTVVHLEVVDPGQSGTLYYITKF
jgi:hypothetical protein